MVKIDVIAVFAVMDCIEGRNNHVADIINDGIALKQTRVSVQRWLCLYYFSPTFTKTITTTTAIKPAQTPAVTCIEFTNASLA